MREHTTNNLTYQLPDALNTFQLDMYIHLINWKWQHITKLPGVYRGNAYDAILPPAYQHAAHSAILYPDIQAHLSQYQSQNKFRLHEHFFHMASSQAANLNLFLPILYHPKADAILRDIKSDIASIARAKLYDGYCIEYWGGNFAGPGLGRNGKGLLNDKAGVGTDSDIAIAYLNHKKELCLWLIEHKLTEAEFTACGGFRSKGRQSCHACSSSFSDIIAKKNLCYYHDRCRYDYWDITERNLAFFPNHTHFPECPFQGGVNQLWRNQLLGLAIERDPAMPFKHVTFSVVKHPRNTHLDSTIADYQRLIADNPNFTVFTSADALTAAKAHADQTLHAWIDWYRDLYNV